MNLITSKGAQCARLSTITVIKLKLRCGEVSLLEVGQYYKREKHGGCISDLGWERSGGESVPAVAGVV